MMIFVLRDIYYDHIVMDCISLIKITGSQEYFCTHVILTCGIRGRILKSNLTWAT